MSGHFTFILNQNKKKKMKSTYTHTSPIISDHQLLKQELYLKMLDKMEKKADLFFKYKEKEPMLTEEQLYFKNKEFRTLYDQQLRLEEQYIQLYMHTHHHKKK